MIDVIIRQAHVVDTTQDHIADIAIHDGRIIEVSTAISQSANHEIDAHGLLLLPGGIDPHVHFNEPGRTEWEGFATGSAALAKGGITSFFDMPLNSTPPVTTVKAVHEKRQLADEKSIVNAYLWGGLTPDNLDELEALVQTGVIGFKAFMSNSGIDDYRNVDDYSLYRGMEILAPHGAIVAVHAENDTITQQLAQKAIQAGRLSVNDYLQSRPIIAELEAIQRAILFASETGCKLHIVHISSSNGVDLVTEARQKGIDVTCETCPHYLALTDSDVRRIGAAAKCAPPIRSQQEQDKLWHQLGNGLIDFIASDHSPAPMSLKQGDDFFSIWGGIAGCQSTLPLLLTLGYHQRGLSLQQIVALTSTNVAERFGLPNKGAIRAGMDADLVLIDLSTETVLQATDLMYRHQVSPYVGMSFKVQVQKTWVGGKLVYG
ncbi:MAG: allantoinase AllB [Phototrophicaceae bacterium]